MQVTRLLILFSILASDSVVAETEPRVRKGGPAYGIRLTEIDGTSRESRIYIVQLATPSAAEFHASTTTGMIGKPKIGQTPTDFRFNKNSAAIQSYVQRIEDEQATVIAKVGNNIEQLYNYRYSLNGFAVRMSPVQANKMEHLPEVLNVWEDEVRPLTTELHPHNKHSKVDIFKSPSNRNPFIIVRIIFGR